MLYIISAGFRDDAPWRVAREVARVLLWRSARSRADFGHGSQGQEGIENGITAERGGGRDERFELPALRGHH